VRFIVSGGAPLAPHVEDFCAACLAPVLQGYGLTETCGGAFITQPDPRLAHTCGPPLTTIEFRLESVKELNYDAAGRPPRGEVQLRG
jgi:long-chain acyl-CoA synthetase